MASSPNNTDVRKLQITGGSTYILSLPKRWIEQMGLKKGGRVNLLRQDDGAIVVTPEDFEVGRTADAIIEVKSTRDLDFTLRNIVSTYLVGYNVIYVRAINRRLDYNQRSIIKEFTRSKLVGTEILADSPQEIIIKVLLSYPELSVESALRRMSIITASMHDDGMKSLAALDKKLAHEVIYMDNEVDRFSFYIIRQLKAALDDTNTLKEIGLSTRRDCLGYRLITKSVERTADHAVKIAENVLKLHKLLDDLLYDQVASMSKSAVTIFKETTEILFKRDFHLANEIVQKAKQTAALRNELMTAILQRANISEVSSLSLIVESITRVAEYASDIAEIILNLNVDQIIF